MLVSTKLGADFSRGCTIQRIGQSFLATHPYRALRRWFYISLACPVALAAVNLHSLLKYLVAGNKSQGGAIGHSPLG
jgi:hypothetical protein